MSPKWLGRWQGGAAMRSISPFHANPPAQGFEARSAAAIELARHSLDLRLHALILLGTAILAAYCGYRASGASNDGIADDPGLVAATPDTLSMCACLAFVA